MTAFPTETYKGSNKSHRKFRDTYGYLNALYYLVVSCRSQLENRLSEDIKKPGIAVGVVTHPISNTQFQGVFVHKEDARQMAADFGCFLATFQRQTIISSYRVLMIYLTEFLLEISDRHLVTLDKNQLRRLSEGFVSSKMIGDMYEAIGIPIATDAHEKEKLAALAATRNVIEHNDGKVNEEYLKITRASLQVGDFAPAGSKEVGEALAIAEWLSDSVNKRGLKRWPELTN